MRVLNEDLPTDIEVKRFYVPFTVEDDCPSCGATVTACSPTEYLSYPVANEPFEVTFYCGACEDRRYETGDDSVQFEWTGNQKLVISIRGELVDG